MKHFAAPVALLLSLTVVVAAGCEDDTGQTVGPDVRAQGGPPQNAVLEGQINHLIDQLFPQPEQERADELFAEMKSSLAQGDQSGAQDAALDLLALAGSTDLEDPAGPQTAAEGLAELIGLLSEFTGLDVPEPSPELLSTDEDDGVISVAFDGQDNTIVTRDSFAGTFIPDEAIAENLLIVIDRKTDDDLDGGACLPLPTSLEQAEGCYQFDREPEGVFQDSVDVGVCPDPAITNDEGFQLHEFENAGDGVIEGVEALPTTAFPEIDCSGFTVSSASDSPLPWRLARAAWGATGDEALGWLGPAPAWAIDAGNGGSTLDFSRIGWAKQMDVDVDAGDGQTATAGTQVSTDPRVRVTHLPESDDSHPLPNVDVEFTATAGAGTVTGGNASTTVATASNGEASVSWTLGNPGTNELEASVPGETVVFSASSTPVSPSSVDAVVANLLAGNPVYFNDGAGNFTASSQTLGTTLHVDIAIGDVDGDEVPDDVVVADNGGSNPIFLNDGSGTFMNTGGFFPGSKATNNSVSVALGDLNGDGFADAVFGNDGIDSTRVWINDGNGNGDFSEGQTLNVGESPDVALADVNGDEDLDVVLGREDATDAVWLNDGTASFTLQQSFGSTTDPHAIALGDLDGDGDPDLFEAESPVANSVWINNGSGTFTNTGQSLGSAKSQDVALADVDGDQDLDAFVANRDGEPNKVWLNDGSAGFTDSGQSIGTGDSSGVGMADLDGDGDVDAFVVNDGEPNLIWLNDGTGNFTESESLAGTNQSLSVALGDLDGQ